MFTLKIFNINITLWFILKLNLINSFVSKDETLVFRMQKSTRHIEVVNSKYRELKLTNTSIYGNSSQFYYYYVDILIGNPPKRQSFITDTGSTLMATPCGDICKHCGTHLNSYYNINSNIIYYK